MSIALGATATTTRYIGSTPITKRYLGSTLVWTSFSPLSLSPALWLSDTGTNAAQWDDLSGNGRHAKQATGSAQPTITAAALNGRQVRRFDGGDSMSLDANLSLGTSHTIFIVAKNTATITAATSAQLLLAGGSYAHPSTTTSELLFGCGAISGVFTNERLYSIALCYSAPGQIIAGYAKTDADVAGAFIVSNRFTTTGPAFSGRFNGSSSFLTTSTAGGYSGTNTNYPTIVRHVGSRGNGTLFWNGDIAEIIVFTTALSDANRLAVEAFLTAKWMP